MQTLIDQIETPAKTDAAMEFERLFGPPIDLWVYEAEEWHHPVDAVMQDLTSELLEVGLILPESLPQSPASLPVPHVEELASGVFLIGAFVAVPPTETSPDGSTVFVWGTVKTTAAALVATSIRLSTEQNLLRREVAEARIGNMPHLEQISSNFEELTWLRRLGEEVVVCDGVNPLVDMARRVLPDLCALVKAEGLVFVATASANPTIPNSPTEVGRPLVWVGRQVLDDEACARLIASLNADQWGHQPFVRNHLAPERDGVCPEVRSYVVVPAVHQERCFGWLVALNRMAWQQPSYTMVDLVPTGLRDDEFGTGDASLMSSAAAMLASQARNVELFREKELLLIGIIRSLINAIDAKDSYTAGHSDRVALMSRCIGEEIGLDSRQCEHLYMAGLLHDIGKIGIPDYVLHKPGELTDEEFAIIRQHPSIGYGILNNLPQLQPILPGVLYHHESVDGRGYPAGLSEEQIPLFGRILAVADAFDAMTSCRPYRTAMTVEKAESILTHGAGTHWDARIVEAFFAAGPAIQRACREVEQSIQTSHASTTRNRFPGFAPVEESILRAVSSIGTETELANGSIDGMAQQRKYERD